jgi:hypothetical protein
VLDGEARVRAAVREAEADIVLLDGRGFPERVVERLHEVRDERAEALIVVLVGDLDTELIEAALEAGALVCMSAAAVLPQLQGLLSDSVIDNGQGQVALMANAVAAPALMLRGRGSHQRPHRPRPLGDRADGQVPPVEHLPQAGRGQPHGGEPLRPAQRPLRSSPSGPPGGGLRTTDRQRPW